jgi:uncharacterized protein involved in exopolysaccharide biosynthesis
MLDTQNLNINEENDLKKLTELILRNYRLFLFGIIVAMGMAFILNHYLIPSYRISSSVLIKDDSKQQISREPNDYLNSSLLKMNQNFQNELWVLKSSPVIEQTIRNLDLSVKYYRKKSFQYLEAYKDVPFRIVYEQNHVQPINVKFRISFLDKQHFELTAETGKTSFYNFEKNEISFKKNKFSLKKYGKPGVLIENSEMAFTVELDTASVVNNTEITNLIE